MSYGQNSRFIDPITREIDAEADAYRRAHGHITKLQSRQLAWLRRWSRTERREGLRGYYIDCQTCGTVDCQHVASEAARVLLECHAGHDTWIRMLPGHPVARTWW